MTSTDVMSAREGTLAKLKTVQQKYNALRAENGLAACQAVDLSQFSDDDLSERLEILQHRVTEGFSVAKQRADLDCLYLGTAADIVGKS